LLYEIHSRSGFHESWAHSLKPGAPLYPKLGWKCNKLSAMWKCAWCLVGSLCDYKETCYTKQIGAQKPYWHLEMIILHSTLWLLKINNLFNLHDEWIYLDIGHIFTTRQTSFHVNKSSNQIVGMNARTDSTLKKILFHSSSLAKTIRSTKLPAKKMFCPF
jgi:hypothetical protein